RGRGHAAARPLVLVRQTRCADRAPHAPVVPAAHAPLAARDVAVSDQQLRAVAGPELRFARGSTRGDPAPGALEDRRGLRHRARRALQRRLPLPARRVAVAQAVPDRRRGPLGLDHLGGAKRAARVRRPEVAAMEMPAPSSALLRNSKAVRWAVGIGAAVMVAIAIVLLFLLTLATNNRELYERNYGRLLVLNAVVAGILLLVIVWVAVRLFSRLRRGKFGSRLLVKLAAIFALVGFAPGLLIYVVSYQFV